MHQYVCCKCGHGNWINDFEEEPICELCGGYVEDEDEDEEE